jgi:hypothetical protein
MLSLHLGEWRYFEIPERKIEKEPGCVSAHRLKGKVGQTSPARLNRLRKKTRMTGEIPQKHPSGAEARLLFSATYGTTEVVPFQNREFFRKL